jgi:hypothetical protein
MTRSAKMKNNLLEHIAILLISKPSFTFMIIGYAKETLKFYGIELATDCLKRFCSDLKLQNFLFSYEEKTYLTYH